MPKPKIKTLHDAVLFGKIDAVERFIVTGVGIDTIAYTGPSSPCCSPLYYVSDSSHAKFYLETYQAIILLLEAGADPLQIHTCNQYYAETSPLLEIFDSNHLALARLFLWYAPYYEDRVVLTKIIKNPTPMSLKRSVEIADKLEIYEKKGRRFAYWINETAKDAKEAQVLEREVGALMESKNYAAAATRYFRIAVLYAKHEALEASAVCRVLEASEAERISKDTLIYYPTKVDDPYNATPEEYRPVLRAHYRAKKLGYLEKAEACFAELKGFYPNQKSIDDHAGVLDLLIEHYKANKGLFLDLVSRAAKVRMQTPLEGSAEVRVAPAAAAAGGAGVASSDAVTVAFEGVAELGEVAFEDELGSEEERIALVRHKESATGRSTGVALAARVSLFQRHKSTVLSASTGPAASSYRFGS